MGQKLGKQSFCFTKPPVIAAAANIVGPMEGDGPLAAQFDWIMDDILFGELTFERAESKMLRESAKLALRKINWQPQEIDFFLAGDLLNQIISANFAARGIEAPFLGLFGACSTFAEAIMIGSMLIDGGFAARVLVASGSHHNAAERQFRFPIEQGAQRPPFAQWTVTGSGALALADQGQGPVVTMGTAGKVVDLGISDPNNMGAAMAPAAADTLINHFQDTGSAPADYDLILTGDLGTVGSEALKNLMKMQGYLLEGNYCDCGTLIYDLARQDVHAGGSGCGCSSVVFTGSIWKQLNQGRYRKVLLEATGALMSPTSSQQGETIPGVAHAVVVECPNLA
jgi:stage V sporulation protein AD